MFAFKRTWRIHVSLMFRYDTFHQKETSPLTLSCLPPPSPLRAVRRRCPTSTPPEWPCCFPPAPSSTWPPCTCSPRWGGAGATATLLRGGTEERDWAKWRWERWFWAASSLWCSPSGTTIRPREQGGSRREFERETETSNFKDVLRLELAAGLFCDSTWAEVNNNGFFFDHETSYSFSPCPFIPPEVFFPPRWRSVWFPSSWSFSLHRARPDIITSMFHSMAVAQRDLMISRRQTLLFYNIIVQSVNLLASIQIDFELISSAILAWRRVCRIVSFSTFIPRRMTP